MKTPRSRILVGVLPRSLVRTLLVVVVAASCHNQGPEGGDGGTGATHVGPSGGTVLSPDGRVKLEVPPGALNASVELQIVEDTHTVQIGDTSLHRVGPALVMSPSGLHFSVPARLTIRTDLSPIELANTHLHEFLPQSGYLVWLQNERDTARGTITALVDHFSIFWSYRQASNTTLGRRPYTFGITNLPSKCEPDLLGGPGDCTSYFLDADAKRAMQQWEYFLSASGITFAYTTPLNAEIQIRAMTPAAATAYYGGDPLGASNFIAYDGVALRNVLTGERHVVMNDDNRWVPSFVAARRGQGGATYEGVLLHELGHIIGIDHISPGDTPPVMATTRTYDIPPSLRCQDVTALRNAYSLSANSNCGTRLSAFRTPSSPAVIGAHANPLPAVKVTDAAGNPVGRVPVLFVVAQGAGLASGVVQSTDLQGIATVGDWVYASAGANTLIAKTASGYLSPFETVFTVTVGPGLGTVTGSVVSSLGGGLAGVTVTAAPSGRSASTNATGGYTVTSVPAGAATLSVTGLPNNCAAPSLQAVTVIAGQTATVNFTATCVSPTGTVAGTVTSSLGGGLAGITVTAAPSGRSTTSSGSGGYTITNVPSGAATVSVSALPANCVAPAAQTVAVPAGQMATVNFTVACSLTTGGIAGTVTSPDLGLLAGITVTAGALSTTTNGSGGYALSGLALGSVSVRVSNLPSSCIDPGFKNVTVIAGATATANFTVDCPPPSGSIAGTVTSPQLGMLSAVTVSAAGLSTVTNGSGGYTLNSVPTGSATVSLSGLPTSCSNPGNQIATVTKGQTSTVNFTASCLSGTTNVWTARGQATVSAVGAKVGVANGVLYAFGGVDNNRVLHGVVQAYDPATDSWSVRTPMPTLRWNFSVSVVNGTIYLFGGIAAGAYTNLVEAYDPATDRWTTKTSMPTPRADMAVADVNGNIYVIGGNVPLAGGAGAVESGLVEVYNPSTDSWQAAASMPTARFLHRAGVINSVIYVVGGIGGGPILGTTEAYSLSSNTWSTSTPMPTPRYAMGVGVVGGILYVVGGEAQNVLILDVLEGYSSAVGTWSTLAPLPQPLFNVDVGVVNGIVYALGESSLFAYQP